MHFKAFSKKRYQHTCIKLLSVSSFLTDRAKKNAVLVLRISEDEPLEAMDLSPEDRKSEITKWLISQNLVPVGNLKIRTPDGSTIRVLNEIELEFIHSFGYTNDDINNALTFNLRA